MNVELNDLPKEVLEIGHLIVKFNENAISAEETVELNEWLARSEINRKLFEDLKNKKLVQGKLTYFKDAEESKERSFKKFIALQGLPLAAITPLRKVKHGLWKMIATAAVVTGVISAGAYFWLAPNSKTTVAKTHTVHDKLPGKEGAILRLSNGEEIVLDNAADGSLAHEGSTEITKKGGQLLYEGVDNSGKVLYNTLITPPGRQFKLRLPDQTEIWLNAGTSVTYPTVFDPKERLIKIDGEVFLDVAKDRSRPFRIDVQGSTVEVLGTKFNVNGYAGQKVVKTTLVEGKVSVKYRSDLKTLEPGQQAEIRNENLSVVNGVDIETTTAWKDGFIVFTGNDIHEILQQVARWYQIDVRYQGDVHSADIKGRAPRNAPLSDVIKVLELSSGLKFVFEGNTLTVKRP